MARKLWGSLIGLEVFLFSMLEGSMVTLGILVAPVVFSTITSRDEAGRVFGNILNVWLWLGLACSILLVASAAFITWRIRPLNPWLLARLILAVLITGFIGVFGVVLSRINTIQNGLTKPIEDYPTNVDPRKEFDTLHTFSTNLVSVALFLGIGWLIVSVIALLKFRTIEPMAVIHPATKLEEPASFSVN